MPTPANWGGTLPGIAKSNKEGLNQDRDILIYQRGPVRAVMNVGHRHVKTFVLNQTHRGNDKRLRNFNGNFILCCIGELIQRAKCRCVFTASFLLHGCVALVLAVIAIVICSARLSLSKKGYVLNFPGTKMHTHRRADGRGQHDDRKKTG